MTLRQPALWRNRNFRRFFAGQFVTNAGDSLYTVAVLWLAFELSGSTAVTGALNAILLLPWLLQVFAGPLVDRWNIRRLLVATQLIQCVVIAALPVASHFGYLSVWLVLTVMPLLALLNQLVYPAQTAALPRIVEQDELDRFDSEGLYKALNLTVVHRRHDAYLTQLVGVDALIPPLHVLYVRLQSTNRFSDNVDNLGRNSVVNHVFRSPRDHRMLGIPGGRLNKNVSASSIPQISVRNALYRS